MLLLTLFPYTVLAHGRERITESPLSYLKLDAHPLSAQENNVGKIPIWPKQQTQEASKHKQKLSFFFSFQKKKEYPIFHVNIDNLLNKILSFIIFLFSSSNVGVVLKHLKYVRYWKDKPAKSRGTDGFSV